MGQIGIDFSAAADRRDSGMSRAADHADHVAEGWTDRADGYLLEFLATKSFGAFLAEEVREFAMLRGLDSPPDGRAWGAVINRAAKRKIIKRVGYAPAKSSNCSPKCLWVGV